MLMMGLITEEEVTYTYNSCLKAIHNIPQHAKNENIKVLNLSAGKQLIDIVKAASYRFINKHENMKIVFKPAKFNAEEIATKAELIKLATPYFPKKKETMNA